MSAMTVLKHDKKPLIAQNQRNPSDKNLQQQQNLQPPPLQAKTRHFRINSDLHILIKKNKLSTAQKNISNINKSNISHGIISLITMPFKNSKKTRIKT
jgi:hypothetical protein